MTQTSWPFHTGTSGTPVLEDQWSQMARYWSGPGVAPFGNLLEVYADSSGRQVKVKTGRAAVRGHWYESTAIETLTIAANASGNPRIDRVVLRLDPAANSVQLAVITGTPAGTPAAPALTLTDVGIWELPLARVAVANGAATITAGNVTDERVYIAGPPAVGASTRRPAAPVWGQRLFEADTGKDLTWNGSAWVDPRKSLVAWRWSPPAPGPGLASWLPSFPDNVLDPAGMLDAGRSVVTIPDPGIWMVNMAVNIENIGTPGLTFGSLGMNVNSGATDVEESRHPSIGGMTTLNLRFATVRNFAAGDTITPLAKVSNGYIYPTWGRLAVVRVA
jgi:hypothetical protein